MIVLHTGAVHFFLRLVTKQFLINAVIYGGCGQCSKMLRYALMLSGAASCHLACERMFRAGVCSMIGP